MADENPVSEAFALVKTYVKQNTIDELKPAGSFLKRGVPGAILASFGGVMILLGILRLLQGSDGQRFTRGLSFVPYLITLLVCAVIVVVAFVAVRRPTLRRRQDTR